MKKKLDVAHNWQVDNNSFSNKFKGSSQCGPTSCCIMLSAYIEEAEKDSFIKEFISDMDSKWLKGVGERKTAVQGNYKSGIESYLKKHKLEGKLQVKVHPSGATLEDIKEALSFGSPIMTSTKLTDAGHYICMVGIDEEKGVFIFHDPYGRFDFKTDKYAEVKDKAGEYVEYPIKDMIPVMEASSKAANGPKASGFRIIYLEKFTGK
jgi:hypothetical protein